MPEGETDDIKEPVPEQLQATLVGNKLVVEAVDNLE
jgi:hypothetical protein